MNVNEPSTDSDYFEWPVCVCLHMKLRHHGRVHVGACRDSSCPCDRYIPRTALNPVASDRLESQRRTYLLGAIEKESRS